MATIDIIIGSTLGGAEYVAEHLDTILQNASHQTTLHYQPDFAHLSAKHQSDHLWLIVTSTHGAGQVPDNLAPFTHALAQESHLSGLRYGIVAIGDSNYDTFCAAGRQIDELLEKLAAQRIGERLEIDVADGELPEDSAENWLETWLPLIDKS